MNVCLSTRPLSRCTIVLRGMYGIRVTRLTSLAPLRGESLAVKKVIATIHRKCAGAKGPCNVTGIRSCSNSTRFTFFNGR